MTRRVTCPAVLLCACLCLVGCATYKDPQLSVAEARATERTPDGTAVLFTIDAKNDNDEPLPLREVQYRLELNGRAVFSGVRSAEATLRRRGVQQFTLPASVSSAGDAAPSGPSRYVLSGVLYYITPGQLAETLFDAGVRTPSVSFRLDGEVDLSAAPFTATTEASSPSGAE